MLPFCGASDGIEIVTAGSDWPFVSVRRGGASLDDAGNLRLIIWEGKRNLSKRDSLLMPASLRYRHLPNAGMFAMLAYV